MRKGIQSDEEFRSRYWRLLPDDDSIPYPPIPQDDFSEETQYTRASREVRSIYRERFEDYRASQRGGCGLVLATMGMRHCRHGTWLSRSDAPPRTGAPPAPYPGCSACCASASASMRSQVYSIGMSCTSPHTGAWSA